MPELLREGQPLPPFTLRTGDGKEFVYATLGWKRRVVVAVLPHPLGAKERAWLTAARGAATEFAERDVTVLLLTARVDDAPEWKDLPDPLIRLRDEGGKVSERLGGPTALYLVGKDRGVKRATRALPAPEDLFRQVDAMPMRRQEMRERG
jgi:hypothetical protein